MLDDIKIIVKSHSCRKNVISILCQNVRKVVMVVITFPKNL